LDSNKDVIEYYDINSMFYANTTYQTIVANDDNAYIGCLQISRSSSSNISAFMRLQKAGTYGYKIELTIFGTNDQYVGLDTITINPPNLYSLTVSATSSVQTFDQPYVATD